MHNDISSNDIVRAAFGNENGKLGNIPVPLAVEVAAASTYKPRLPPGEPKVAAA